MAIFIRAQMVIGCGMKDYIREAKKISNEFGNSLRHSEVKKAKLNLMIDLAIDIEGCGPTGSGKVAAEIRDDPVDISFSTYAREMSSRVRWDSEKM